MHGKHGMRSQVNFEYVDLEVTLLARHEVVDWHMNVECSVAQHLLLQSLFQLS